MRIIQVVPRLVRGDAVGNDVLAIAEIIRKQGYKTCIYADDKDPGIPTALCKSTENIPRLDRSDLILYHFAIGSELSYRVAEYPCRKVIVYHNVTPARFFQGVDPISERLCNQGRRQLRYLASRVDACLAVSEYNKSDLIEMGYKCPISVIPILIPFADYDASPDAGTMLKYYGDGCKNILFTGRIAPNKKQEDIISAFYYYQSVFNADSRLFLVGSFDGCESYYERLKAFIDKLNLDNVIITGHVAFSKLLAYYQVADVFVCMSEHEGFCVPLVEAMKLNLPIIAYNSCAVGETLGGAGILLDEKAPLEIAGIINRLISDDELRASIVENGRERLQIFSYEAVKRQLIGWLNMFIG